MRLTRFSDIGLRVLMYLTRAGDDRAPVTVAEIAGQFDIPQSHLVKVVGQLVRAGWLQATRGRNGGIRLNTDPRTLRIGVVLRELEGTNELADCEGQDCRLSRSCILRGALKAGQDAFFAAMDAYTLDDIAGSGTGEAIVRMHASYLRQVSEFKRNAVA